MNRSNGHFLLIGSVYNVKNFSALYNQVIASSPMKRGKSSFKEWWWETIKWKWKAVLESPFWDFRNSWCNSYNYWSILSNRWSICINWSWCKPRVFETRFSSPCISFILVLWKHQWYDLYLKLTSTNSTCAILFIYVLWIKPVSITASKE